MPKRLRGGRLFRPVQYYRLAEPESQHQAISQHSQSQKPSHLEPPTEPVQQRVPLELALEAFIIGKRPIELLKIKRIWNTFVGIITRADLTNNGDGFRRGL